MNNLLTIEQAQQALDSIGAGQAFTVCFITVAGDERQYTGKLLDGPALKVDIPFQVAGASGAIKSFNLNRVVSIHAMHNGAYI